MKTKAVILEVSDISKSYYGLYRIFTVNEKFFNIISNYLYSKYSFNKSFYLDVGYDNMNIIAEDYITEEDIDMIKIILSDVEYIKLTAPMYEKRNKHGFSGWLLGQNIKWED